MSQDTRGSNDPTATMSSLAHGCVTYEIYELTLSKSPERGRAMAGMMIFGIKFHFRIGEFCFRASSIDPFQSEPQVTCTCSCTRHSLPFSQHEIYIITIKRWVIRENPRSLQTPLSTLPAPLSAEIPVPRRTSSLPFACQPSRVGPTVVKWRKGCKVVSQCLSGMRS